MKTRLSILLLAHFVVGCSREPMPTTIRTVIVTNPSPIVIVSDHTPDPYVHPTTHPSSLFDELNLDMDIGHGDGVTEIGFVGKVVQITNGGNIQPIPGARFYRLNDSMLLRKSLHDPLPVASDKDGDFQIMTSVFAAYGCKKGSFLWNESDPLTETDIPNPEAAHDYHRRKFQKANDEGEWVIYQTGTATLGVEADGFSPRKVNVNYEQPSTLIVLNKEN